MKLVSACLLGVKCNFEGKSWLDPKVLEEFKKGGLFPVCPEVLGGLPIPRVPAEIVDGDGYAVLEGKASVINIEGKDVTCEFIKGAYEVLKILRVIGAQEAWLIEKSPSCGYGNIFDGTFSGKFKEGDGVTVALLKKNGVKVRCIEVSEMH